MTHPVTDVLTATALVVAVGAGAAVFLPRAAPEPVSQIVALTREQAPALTDAARVEALQRELARIAAEQKRLNETVRAIAASRKGAERLRQRSAR